MRVESRFHQAVRLWAAADAIRTAAGVPSGDPDARQAADMAKAKTSLGERSYAEAWAAGAALTLDHAVAAALAPLD